MRTQQTPAFPHLPLTYLVRAMLWLALVGLAFIGKTAFAAPNAAEDASYTITGTLRDYDGTPIASGTVWFWGSGSNFGSVSTDANGRYTITGIADTYHLRVSKNNYPAPPDRAVTVPPSLTGIDFTFPQRYTITGTVRDYDGAPLASATVWFWGKGTYFGSVTTDASGRYTILANADTYRLQVGRGNYPAPPDRTVTVPPNLTGIDFTFPQRYTISGTVRDYDGTPLVSAIVWFWGSGSNFGSVSTDATGRYTILANADTYHLRVGKDNYPAPPDQNVTVPPSLTSVNFTFPQRYPITGVVRDASGAPLAQATVTFFGNGAYFGSVSTDTSGRYTINASADTYRISASKTLYQTSPIRTVTVPPAQSNIDFTLLSSAVKPMTTTIMIGSSSWLLVSTPFVDDTNANSFTTYEYGTSSQGPWTPVCDNGIAGESAWRQCAFGGLNANTKYYVRITFQDPDGVNGLNPKVLGPISTSSTVNNGVTIASVATSVWTTYLLVTANVYGDANMNSRLESVDVATSATGPWTQKCGPYTSFAPKLCRLHGLTTNTKYWIRTTVSDPDGVSGTNPRVIGPVLYTGLTNLALNKPITADPGWGCCANAAQLVDGRIQYPDWTYGYAWSGGTNRWGGGDPGWKQATIDLGSSQLVGRVDWFTHDAANVPSRWKIEVSSNGQTYQQVFATSTPFCRTATQQLNVHWRFPSCGHSGRFTPITARYVRYSFDDTTLFGGIHGWGVELEVFKSQTAAAVNAADTTTPDAAYDQSGLIEELLAHVDDADATANPTTGDGYQLAIDEELAASQTPARIYLPMIMAGNQ